MKLKLIIVSIMILLICNLSNLVTANEYVYVNDNNVTISSRLYDKLVSVGYTEKEIKKLELDKIDKVKFMNIFDITKDELYVRTTTVHNIDGSMTSTNEYIDVNEYNESIATYASYPNEYSTVTIDYKKLTITGTYYYDQEDEGLFFIKVNVEYLDTPNDRYEDMLAINFTDDIQLKSYYSSGSQYIDFEAKITYTEHFFQDYKHQYGNPIYEDRTTEKEVVITGESVGQYNHDLNKHIAVKFQLPKDEVWDYTGEIVDQYHEYEYYDFFFTMEANFIPQVTNLNACGFAGVFIHQNGFGSIDWGKITFTPTYPYFSYSTSIWVNDPNFDATVAKEIMFENLSSY